MECLRLEFRKLAFDKSDSQKMALGRSESIKLVLFRSPFSNFEYAKCEDKKTDPE